MHIKLRVYIYCVYICVFSKCVAYFHVPCDARGYVTHRAYWMVAAMGIVYLHDIVVIMHVHVNNNVRHVIPLLQLVGPFVLGWHEKEGADTKGSTRSSRLHLV